MAKRRICKVGHDFSGVGFAKEMGAQRGLSRRIAVGFGASSEAPTASKDKTGNC
jgi:hypothetical protein